MKILLAEEYAERERLALLMLQAVLAERGHEVVLSNSWELERDYRRLRPDVVVDNISDTLAHYVGKLGMLTHGQRNVNLIWEQFINPVNLLRYQWEERFYLGYVDGRVAWGEPFSTVLCHENPGLDPNRICVAGSIKHASDVLVGAVGREALLQFFPEEYAKYERIVVYADAFPTATWDFHAFRGSGVSTKVPYLYELCIFARRMREESLSMVRRLAETCPDTLFVIRTHPGKDANYYRTFEAQFTEKNVAINYSGDISALLGIADLMLSTRSGTLVDAHFTGIPAVNLVCTDHPFVTTNVLLTPEDEFGHRLAPDDVTAATLEDLYRLPLETDQSTATRDTWFHTTDFDAFENTANFIERIADMPPLRKRLPARDLLDVEVARRATRNALRSQGVGIKTKKTHPFDYRGVFELMRDVSPLRKGR